MSVGAVALRREATGGKDGVRRRWTLAWVVCLAAWRLREARGGNGSGVDLAGGLEGAAEVIWTRLGVTG